VQVTPGDEVWPDEENTGVGDPLQQLNARTKNTGNVAKAAFGAISELRRAQKVAVEQDKEDHERIYTSMDDVKSKVGKLEGQVERLDGKVDKVDGKVDNLAEHVGNLREESARTGAHVERLVAVIGVRETAGIKADIHIETVRKEVDIKDQAAVKKLKRTLFLKFAIPIVTALATAISAYFITR
jgi:seryl-tRNA synthetase